RLVQPACCAAAARTLAGTSLPRALSAIPRQLSRVLDSIELRSSRAGRYRRSFVLRVRSNGSGHTATYARPSAGQAIQELARLMQVPSSEALGEPVVNPCQQVMLLT